MFFFCFQMSEEDHNPWAVPNIDSFNFLCCPECVYRSKEESSFQTHALQNHPKSKKFFKYEETDKIDANLHYCCPECTYRSKNMNNFQIHALENHPLCLVFFNQESDNNESSKLDIL